jgi:hypothetical protein
MEENLYQLERRCPRLGGPVLFAYCKTSGDDHSVCWKIFDCWWECFDVVGYLKKFLPEHKFKKLANSKPKQKIVSLVELVEQAKKRIS